MMVLLLFDITNQITHQSGCVCLALIVFVGPISSRQYEIAWSLDITRAIIGPLDM